MPYLSQYQARRLLELVSGNKSRVRPQEYVDRDRWARITPPLHGTVFPTRESAQHQLTHGQLGASHSPPPLPSPASPSPRIVTSKSSPPLLHPPTHSSSSPREQTIHDNDHPLPSSSDSPNRPQRPERGERPSQPLADPELVARTDADKGSFSSVNGRPLRRVSSAGSKMSKISSAPSFGKLPEPLSGDSVRLSAASQSQTEDDMPNSLGRRLRVPRHAEYEEFISEALITHMYDEIESDYDVDTETPSRLFHSIGPSISLTHGIDQLAHVGHPDPKDAAVVEHVQQVAEAEQNVYEQLYEPPEGPFTPLSPNVSPIPEALSASFVPPPPPPVPTESQADEATVPSSEYIAVIAEHNMPPQDEHEFENLPSIYDEDSFDDYAVNSVVVDDDIETDELCPTPPVYDSQPDLLFRSSSSPPPPPPPPPPPYIIHSYDNVPPPPSPPPPSPPPVHAPFTEHYYRPNNRNSSSRSTDNWESDVAETNSQRLHHSDEYGDIFSSDQYQAALSPSGQSFAHESEQLCSPGDPVSSLDINETQDILSNEHEQDTESSASTACDDERSNSESPVPETIMDRISRFESNGAFPTVLSGRTEPKQPIDFELGDDSIQSNKSNSQIASSTEIVPGLSQNSEESKPVVISQPGPNSAFARARAAFGDTALSFTEGREGKAREKSEPSSAPAQKIERELVPIEDAYLLLHGMSRGLPSKQTSTSSSDRRVIRSGRGSYSDQKAEEREMNSAESETDDEDFETAEDIRSDSFADEITDEFPDLSSNGLGYSRTATIVYDT